MLDGICLNNNDITNWDKFVRKNLWSNSRYTSAVDRKYWGKWAYTLGFIYNIFWWSYLSENDHWKIEETKIILKWISGILAERIRLMQLAQGPMAGFEIRDVQLWILLKQGWLFHECELWGVSTVPTHPINITELKALFVKGTVNRCYNKGNS